MYLKTRKVGGEERCSVVISENLMTILRKRDMVELVKEAIPRLSLPQPDQEQVIEFPFDRVIGHQGCIATAPVSITQLTTFATRSNAPYPSRVIADVSGPSTNIMTMVLAPTAHASVVNLKTAFIGPPAGREPWDRHLKTEGERAKALRFWTTHALIHTPEQGLMGPIVDDSWENILRRAGMEQFFLKSA